VLSVVAQQITSILNAMTTLKSDIDTAIRAKTNMSEEDSFATIEKRWLSKKFTFQGQDIDLVWSCGLFITMNPGLLSCLHASFSSFSLCFLVDIVQVMLDERNCPTT
jgi:hypothetical protein